MVIPFLFLFFVGLAESKFAENTRHGTVATGKPLRPLKHRRGSTLHGLKQANHRTGQNSPYGALQYAYGDSAPFIEFGRGRFTVYAEDLVRIQWKNTSDHWKDPDLLSLTINSRYAAGDFSVTNETKGNTLTIQTFDYYGNSVLNLTFIDDLPTPPGPQQLFVESALMVWPGTPPPRQFLWTLESKQSRNLNGTYSSLDCYVSPSACIDEFWQSRMQPGLLSRDGWNVLNDSGVPRLLPPSPSDPLQWSWPGGDPPNASGMIDIYYQAYGDNFRQALLEIAALSGPPAPPPRAAFGPWWSRYWPYSADSFTSEVLAGYASNSIPLSIAVLDMDWHTTPHTQTCSAWGQLDFNTSLFPDPPSFIEMIHGGSDGKGNLIGHPLELVLNIHPQSGVDKCAERYIQFAEAIGADSSQNATIMCDISNQTYTRALFDVYLSASPLANVDSFWTDYHGCGSNPNSLSISNYAFRSHALALEPARRAVTLSRFGGLGEQRLGGVVFSGDTFQAAEMLDFEVQTTPTASNILVGYLSHDIGGFQNCTSVKYESPNCTGSIGDADPSDPIGSALFLRWVQFGALSAIMRTHCTHCERRIWEFPSVFDHLKDAFLLRSGLVPYLYDAALNTVDLGGIPFLHPVYYDAPDTFEEAYTYTKQYMLGDTLLVAPITTLPTSNGTTSKSVWLPPTIGIAQHWSRWDGSEVLTGPSVDTSLYDLKDIPIFVIARAVIPLAVPGTANDISTSPDLVWNIWPPPKGEETPMYRNGIEEDDGVSHNYTTGAEVLTTQLGYVRNNGTYSIDISADGLTYVGMPAMRSHSVLIRGVSLDATVSNVTVQGMAVPRVNPGSPPPGWWIVEKASLLEPLGSVVVSAGAFPTTLDTDVLITVTVWPPP